MKGDETEALRARLDDLARRAGRLWTPLCSRFLTQEERSLAQRCARENGVLAAFDGGWEGAERSQCCFYPDGLEPDFTGQRRGERHISGRLHTHPFLLLWLLIRLLFRLGKDPQLQPAHTN